MTAATALTPPQRRLRLALAAVAAAERAGRVIDTAGLAEAAGVAPYLAGDLRRGLVKAGWVEEVRIAGGGRGYRVILTDDGWAQAGGRPRVGGAGRRRCLCCGNLFPSEGPHHRLCDRCRNTDAFRDGSATSEYRVMR